MTDLERFIDLYRSFGVILNPVPTNTGTQVRLEAGNVDNEGVKLVGYEGFYSCVEFDGEGAFLRQGFWE